MPPPPGWTRTPISYPASASDPPPRWIDVCGTTVGSFAVYRARYAPTPLPGGAFASWALGPIPDDDAAQRIACSATGTAVVRAERAEMRRHSPAELAAERAGSRAPGAGVYPRDEARRAAVVARYQARAARDQATTRRDEAARVPESAE